MTPQHPVAGDEESRTTDHPVELPSGTLTFLFSDIEASTALWERAPEAMSPALANHDRVLRQTFEGFGGVVFAHRGDGLSVVFTSPSDAIHGAVAAVEANLTQDWGELGQVRIRIGLHSGEAIRRADNYFGSPLNLTSRLTAAAHGNQILVSDTVRMLVGERLGRDIWLQDLGLWFFDGLTRAERVHAVRRPGLEEPPTRLRSGRPAGATFPIPAGRFVGRESESRRIGDALRTSRLVTLCGAGGVGKTRLAIELATRLTERYGAGTRFVDLSRVREQSSVLLHLADALAIRLPPGAESIESLARSINDSSMLVVLDNCEHLSRTVAAHVSSLLELCPSIAVLATTREPLRTSGERVIEVLPLAMGSGSEQGPAVELLVDRAGAADARFDAGDPALQGVAQAVDGLPLALELLAPRLTHMKPAELAEQLAEVGSLISIGGRPGQFDDRLRKAFQWSYGLLDDPAKRLFASLSVCVGGTNLEGVLHLAVAAGLEGTDARRALFDLIDRSLVIANTSGIASRYRMLQPVREFAAECLTELGYAEKVEVAHVEYLAGFVEREGAALRGPDEGAAVARINAEFDNLRAAAQWCARQDRVDLGFRIVAPLVDHLLARGRFEVGAWALALAERPQANQDPLFPIGLGLAALTAMEGGQLAQAAVLSSRALLFEPDVEGQRSWIPYSVRVLLTAAGEVEGDVRSALNALREVVESAYDPMAEAVYHFDRATIIRFGPAPERVMGSAAELERIGSTTGCPSIHAMGLMVKGWGLVAESRPIEAAEALREAMTLSASVANVTISEMAHRDLLDLDRGSIGLYSETLHQFLDQGDVGQVIVTILGILPSLLDLEAYEATATLCGWIGSTPWSRSAQLAHVTRRLEEHLDSPATEAARLAGSRLKPDQVVRFVDATLYAPHGDNVRNPQAG